MKLFKFDCVVFYVPYNDFDVCMSETKNEKFSLQV